MNKILIFVLLTFASLCAAVDDKEDFWLNEGLGEFKIDLGEKAVIKLLGDSKITKGKTQLEGATGEYVQDWHCPDAGLRLLMSADSMNGPKKVRAITGSTKCKLATAKGIKIGSKRAEVVKVYGAFEDKEGAASAGQGTFIAGSVYGGLIFRFAKGKVSEIFVGAAAE
jgi:hypothetical protein